MGIQLFPRQAGLPVTEDSVKDEIRASGLTAMRWEGDPNEHYSPHYHTLTKTLWCAHGDIMFHIDGQDIHLSAGDKMILPDGTVHAADAGPDGVVCYESPPVHENVSVHVDK